MEEPAGEPEESKTRAKLSEAAGQAILLGVVAWTIFTLIQAPWYTQTFHVRPYAPKWVAVTFLTGAVPPLLVLFLAFLVSWLIGIMRHRADPWRAWRDGLVVAAVFTLLINFAIWFAQSR